MALIALTLADTIRYVSDLDSAKTKKLEPIDPADLSKGEREVEHVGDGATIFKLRPLDVFLMGYIYDNAQSLSGKQGHDVIGVHTRINQTNIDAVRHGLAGIENFRDKHGNNTNHSTQKTVVNGREYDVVSDDVMNKLGVQLIAELAGKIKSLSEVSAAEAKNSAGA